MKNNLTGTEAKIVQAAIQCIIRYGVRKSSMAHVASIAGVSRQTLYDSFESKDGLIRAVIRYVTNQSLERVRQGTAKKTSLGDQLDVYFKYTVIASFELLQEAVDIEGLFSGHRTAGKAEVQEAHRRHEILMASLLAPYEARLKRQGLTVEGQAHFLITVIMNLKYNVEAREDLDGLLHGLKTAALAVTAE